MLTGAAHDPQLTEAYRLLISKVPYSHTSTLVVQIPSISFGCHLVVVTLAPHRIGIFREDNLDDCDHSHVPS
jgi:hypothetical protein